MGGECAELEPPRLLHLTKLVVSLSCLGAAVSVDWRATVRPAAKPASSSSQPWIGPVDAAGRPHGVGTGLLPDGSRYTGSMSHGERSGNGTSFSKSRDVFIGEFRNDQMNGFGRWVSANGAEYSGEWVANLRHGHGTLRHGDSSYTGAWHSGQRHGRGVLSENGRLQAGVWDRDVLSQLESAPERY